MNNLGSRCTFATLFALFFSLTGCGTDPPINNQECRGDGCLVIIEEDECQQDSDCSVGKKCISGQCLTGSSDECSSNVDCGPDRHCEQGTCFANARPTRPIADVGPPPEEDMGEGDCRGCVHPATGVCVKGDATEACGGGGAECVECTGGQRCDEGVCIDPPTCDADNCGGCCSGNECLDGTSDTACGTGGAACQTCMNDATCQFAECVVPCNEDTCSGCCTIDGECLEGSTASACGYGGMACTSCGSNQRCSSGRCVDLSCSETCDGCCDGNLCLSGDLSTACGFNGNACVECGTGMYCETGYCRVDPNGRWDVYLVSADVPSRNAGGDTWDAFGGLPDPYVRVIIERNSNKWEGSSSVESDTTNPFWFETVVENVPARALMNKMTVWVRDSDTFSDNTMGGCYTQLRQSDFSGNTFEINCPAYQDYVALTVRFRVYPR